MHRRGLDCSSRADTARAPPHAHAPAPAHTADNWVIAHRTISTAPSNISRIDWFTSSLLMTAMTIDRRSGPHALLLSHPISAKMGMIIDLHGFHLILPAAVQLDVDVWLDVQCSLNSLWSMMALCKALCNQNMSNKLSNASWVTLTTYFYVKSVSICVFCFAGVVVRAPRP